MSGRVRTAIPLAALREAWSDLIVRCGAGDDGTGELLVFGVGGTASPRLTGLGLREPLAVEVERLVVATADHDAAPGDAAAAVLLDADLAILGAERGPAPGTVGRKGAGRARWQYAK